MLNVPSGSTCPRHEPSEPPQDVTSPELSSPGPYPPLPRHPIRVPLVCKYHLYPPKTLFSGLKLISRLPLVTSTPKPKAAVTSSVVAGTSLKGINYIKKLTDPIALPDEDYPQWLWKCLEDRRPQLSSTPQISAEDAADLYSKSKKRRKIAQKRIAAKEAAGGTVLDVPADHRTEDMPWETYEESAEARLEAKKASRARRRAAIKEKNFLGQLG